MKKQSLLISSIIWCVCLLAASNVVNAQAPQKAPKNIIIMIGDGMGPDHVSSALLSDPNSAFRRFKTLGLSLTCSADKLITDSAAGATALSCGQRTNNHMIGLDPEGKPMENVMEFARTVKKSTGVVATSSITNATPAGFTAHVKERALEFDIADQYVTAGHDVAIGGGTDFFLPEAKGGKRTDSTDVIEELQKAGYKVFDSPEAVKGFDYSSKFFMITGRQSLPQADERNYTLAELTQMALSRLSQDKDGFVLMVEGSQIDWGAHANSEKQVKGELKDFNGAIHQCLDFAMKDNNTLVIVTADHETGGVAITGGEKDGSDLKLSFISKGHTAAAVNVFAFGPGEELFRGVQNNYEIGNKVFNLLGKKK